MDSGLVENAGTLIVRLVRVANDPSERRACVISSLIFAVVASLWKVSLTIDAVNSGFGPCAKTLSLFRWPEIAYPAARPTSITPNVALIARVLITEVVLLSLKTDQ